MTIKVTHQRNKIQKGLQHRVSPRRAPPRRRLEQIRDQVRRDVELAVLDAIKETLGGLFSSETFVRRLDLARDGRLGLVLLVETGGVHCRREEDVRGETVEEALGAKALGQRCGQERSAPAHSREWIGHHTSQSVLGGGVRRVAHKRHESQGRGDEYDLALVSSLCHLFRGRLHVYVDKRKERERRAAHPCSPGLYPVTVPHPPFKLCLPHVHEKHGSRSTRATEDGIWEFIVSGCRRCQRLGGG